MKPLFSGESRKTLAGSFVVSSIVCYGLFVLGLATFFLLTLPLMVAAPVVLFISCKRTLEAWWRGEFDRQAAIYAGMLFPLAILTYVVLSMLSGFLGGGGE